MINNLQKEKGWSLIFIIGFIMSMVWDIYLWSAIGICFTVFYTYRLLINMGETIPIIDVIIVIAAFQWIIGPYIDYHNDTDHYKYHMYVSEVKYMSYVVLGLILFKIGTLFFSSNINLKTLEDKIRISNANNPKLPYLLIVIGIFSPYISKIFPNSLAFVFFLISNIKYVGIIYLLFTDNKNKWIIFGVIMGITFLSSLGSGMFHDFILWSILTFTFISRQLKIRVLNKVLLFTVGVFFTISIQAVKSEYRDKAWNNYRGNKLLLFTGLVAKQWSTGEIFTPKKETDMNSRLNQGWIISAIINNVPRNVAYADGSTIYDAVFATLIPRFLNPDKTKAGGRENFMKFTGLKLGKSTSMGISIIGEGYANYGYWGGMFFMFVWGIFIGWFWMKINTLQNVYYTIAIWSPIMFLQVVKAETELVVVLNHLVKSTILIIFILWFMKKRWNIMI